MTHTIKYKTSYNKVCIIKEIDYLQYVIFTILNQNQR